MCWIWMFSNEPNDESNTKRRKTENFAVDISNGPVTQENETIHLQLLMWSLP
jgi:hypothetical protein